jgi:glycosyltransferase involved in cell wall biosynthesis
MSANENQERSPSLTSTPGRLGHALWSVLRNAAGRRQKRHSLVVLDDYFPNLLTGFRVSEFNWYLKAFPDSVVYSCDPGYAADLKAYLAHFPQLGPRIASWSEGQQVTGHAAYCVFLNNAFRFLPSIERSRMPFVFTLYPGGGFWLDHEESDAKLRQVCGSPYFRKVIVTQTVSQEYLLRKQFCDPDQIEFVYGGVFPSDVFNPGSIEKRCYQIDKDTFDICFVAHKYMEKGIDKGYDIFISTAHLIAQQVSEARFHVVGGFDASDIDVAGLGDRIKFYGTRHREFFKAFYSRMDIILSPTVPFRLYEGNFDGFPTGCCIEAGLCGVGVFCTDPLDLNVAFENGKEIVIIPRDPAEIADMVVDHYRDYDKLSQLSAHGQRAFAGVFDLEAQMTARAAIVRECMQGGNRYEPAAAGSGACAPGDTD